MYKGSEKNIHKQLKVYYVFNILNKIAVGSHELHVLGMARQN
jgi:hypothetical protein